MNLPAHLNLRQRYNLTVFIAIALAYCLLIGLLYKVIDNYADDYTSHYWQDYTKTFSDAVKYSVIMRSTSVSEALTHNFASDKMCLKRLFLTTTTSCWHPRAVTWTVWL